MFKTIGDYLVPLMRLLDEMPARRSDAVSVIKGFGWRYQREIPEKHRRAKRTRATQLYGDPIWEQYVRYARNRAVRFGLMDSPEKGFWELTEKGQRWLAENPEATRFERRTKKRAESPPRTQRRHRITRDAYREFFKEIQTRVPELLSDAIRNEPHHFQARANLWQVIFDEFGGCHYQITLRRDYHEIALHFESTRSASHARLNAFQSRVDELVNVLSESVRTGTMGPKGAWGRVWLERAAEPLNESLASAHAAQLARFIAATFPILQETLRVPRARKTERGNDVGVESANPAYRVLDSEIELIRAFLEGRSDHRPTDEKICDWIQFCYLFELYAEGRDLYKLISADGVNAWYLERTRKLAKICALRANR
jgi:hypothetical protein